MSGTGSSDSGWKDLVAAALLGTDRQSPPPDAGVLTNGLPAEPERRLLSQAAALALYRQAGWRPGLVGEPLAPCEPDERPRASGEAAQLLMRILAGEQSEVLPEWLALAASHGLRVPEEHLPALLERARREPSLRPRIGAAGGKPVLWLAEQNSDWRFIARVAPEASSPVTAELSTPEAGESLWQTGAPGERYGALRWLRSTDPDRARAMLEATWPHESPEARATALPILEQGLSMADEPFLEAALDDRRKEVRATAVILLSRLSESRLAKRMRARLEPLIRLTPNDHPLEQPGRLEVTLPEECTPAMARDGVEPKRQVAGLGQKAGWLAQMLAAVSPSLWSEAWQLTPSEALRLVLQGEWAPVFLHGWTEAAALHRDQDWAVALLETAPTTERARMLAPILTAERKESIALRLLAANNAPLQDSDPALVVLRECRHPWSETLGREVLGRVRDRLSDLDSRTSGDWSLLRDLADFALYLPPSLLSTAAADLPLAPKEEVYVQNCVEEFLARLHFRHEMHQAFIGPPSPANS
jgi:hypothetical protein